MNAWGTQSVTLAWDSNADPKTVGYMLYSEDASGDFLNKSDVGANETATVSGLVDGNTYVFYVTAYDAKHQESDPSNRVTFQAVPANVPPAAVNLSLETVRNQPMPVVLRGSDSDNGPGNLTFRVVSAPAHGSLSGAAPNLTYTPALDYSGSDSFRYVANDGLVDSAPATVSINVKNVNRAPVAVSKSVQTSEDQPVAAALSGSDPDGNPITFSIASPPANGSLSGTAPNLTYTPKANFSGTDAFTYRASDGSLNSSPATVTVTVVSVNDPPVAANKNVQTPEDVAAAIVLTATDADGDALTYTVVNGPAHGTLSGTAPNLLYTPAPDFSGQDSFTYTASDGSATSSPATVAITVSPVNEAPVAYSKAVRTLPNQSLAIVLTGDDPDGDTLSFTVVSAPTHGALTGTAPNLTYVPDTNYTGPDSFTFVTNDGALTSAPATIGISVSTGSGKMLSRKILTRRR